MALFENGNGSSAVTWRWIGGVLLAGFMIFAGERLLRLSIDVGVIAAEMTATKERVTRLENRLFPAGH